MDLKNKEELNNIAKQVNKEIISFRENNTSQFYQKNSVAFDETCYISEILDTNSTFQYIKYTFDGAIIKNGSWEGINFDDNVKPTISSIDFVEKYHKLLGITTDIYANIDI